MFDVILCGLLKMSAVKNLIRTAQKFLQLRTGRNQRWCSVAVGMEKQTSLLSDSKPFEEIPSLRILPFVGTAWAFMPIIGHNSLDRFHIASRERRRMFGDIYREKFGSLDLVVVFNPDDIEKVFRNEGRYPSRGELQSLKAYRNSRKQWQGREWWELRSKVQKHLLKPKAITAYLDTMQDLSKELVKKMKQDLDSNREVPKFLDELYKWALESVCIIGLDTKLGFLRPDLAPDSDGGKLIRCSKKHFECMNHLEPVLGNIPFWRYFPTPTWRKFVRASDVFSEIAFRHITRALEDLLNNTDKEKELTILQSMLLEKDLHVSGAMVTVMDMLFAGIDTTSHTLGFLLYHLAENPDKQELLYEEIQRVFPSKETRITPEALNELRYLKSCLKESQRLLPTNAGATRVLDRDIVLSGYRIPAGTGIFPNVYEVSQDDKYFPDAKRFLPERWLARDKSTHPFAYLPFGFGTRMCIGRRFAELEIYSLTTEILRNFRLEYHYENIGLHTRFVFAPDKPLRLAFQER